MRDWGTYRKLCESLPPSFERLPFAVRCMAAEVIRRCDRNGRLVPGDELNDQLVDDLAFHVRAHTGEETFLRQGLGLLLKDGYLVFFAGYLQIRNFVRVQRTDSAERMERKRDRDKVTDSDGGDVMENSDVTKDSARAPPRAFVSSRLVSSDLVTPDQEPPDRSDQNQRARDIREVFEHWKEVHRHPDAKLTSDRRTKINARIDEGFTVAQLKTAVANAKNDSFLMGDNDRGKVYDDLITLLKTGSKVEELVALTAPMARRQNNAKPPGLQQHEQTKPPSHNQFRTAKESRVRMPAELLEKFERPA